MDANSIKSKKPREIKEWLKSQGVNAGVVNTMTTKEELLNAVNQVFKPSNAGGAGGEAPAPVALAAASPAAVVAEGRKVRVVFFGDNHASRVCSVGISIGLTNFLLKTPVDSFLVVSESNDVHQCIKDAGLPPSRVLTEHPLGTNPFTQPEMFTMALIEYSKTFSDPNPQYTKEYYTSLFTDPIAFIDAAIKGNAEHPLLKRFVQLLTIVGAKPLKSEGLRNTAFIAFAREVAKLPEMDADPAAKDMWTQAAEKGLAFSSDPAWIAYGQGHAGRRDAKLFARVKERVLAEPSINKVAIVMGDSHLDNEMALFEADPLFTVDRAASKRWQNAEKITRNFAAASGKKKGGGRSTLNQSRRNRRKVIRSRRTSK